MKPPKGQVAIEQGVNVWEHELHAATALSRAGYKVRFIPTNDSLTSADAYVDGVIFEFKSPEGSNIKSIQRNIVRALNQSQNIVIDSFRMKHIQDRSIKNALITRLKAGKGIKRLIFVTRKGEVIDINSLI